RLPPIGETPGLRDEVEPVDVDPRPGAVGVVRARVADLERVAARGERRAREGQDVARVGGRVLVDVGLRAAVDGDRGDAPVVPLGDVELDLRPREADRGEVVGGVGEAHRAVEAAGDAGACDVGPGADVVDLVLPRAHDGVVHGRDGLGGVRRDVEPVDADD